ncbi:MAG: hypothetical protein ACOYXT_13955 [Bacteroidota bacterium]
MKKLILSLSLLTAVMTLTSSTRSDLKQTVTFACPGPEQVYLVRVGTGKPLYAGMHFLYPNTSYKVYAIGGANSAVVCVTPGAGYTISGSGCQDLGEGNEYVVTVIQTAASIAPSITINVGNTCTSGNGTWTGGYTYGAR